MMKKAISLLLALIFIMSLTACGGSNAPADDTTPPAETTQPDDTQQPSEPEDTAEPDTQPETSYYPVTVTTYDYEGNEIETTYEKGPEKGLCVYQGTIETMIALGLEDHVTASYGLDNPVKAEWEAGLAKMNYNEEVFAPDKETVLMMEPDMIFSWDSIFNEKKLGGPDGVDRQWNQYLYQHQHQKGRQPRPGERVHRPPQHRQDLQRGG